MEKKEFRPIEKILSANAEEVRSYNWMHDKYRKIDEIVVYKQKEEGQVYEFLTNGKDQIYDIYKVEEE